MKYKITFQVYSAVQLLSVVPSDLVSWLTHSSQLTAHLQVVVGSVLHPPSLPPHHLHLYNCLALLLYLFLLVSAFPAMFAIYKVKTIFDISGLKHFSLHFQGKYFYLLPWLVCNTMSVCLETFIFLLLLSKVREVRPGLSAFK